MSVNRSLPPILDRTHVLHSELLPLWDDLTPPSHRSIVTSGFCYIVRQHSLAQFQLVASGLDVSATTLVRPCYESLVRAIWTLHAAEDEWIDGFLTPHMDAVERDAETRKGPPVESMLAAIAVVEPDHVHRPLMQLKDRTWRAMHSYVHGGIRPVAQALTNFPEHEAAGVVINANVMLFMATEVIRMTNGQSSSGLCAIWSRHASSCLPP